MLLATVAHEATSAVAEVCSSHGNEHDMFLAVFFTVVVALTVDVVWMDILKQKWHPHTKRAAWLHMSIGFLLVEGIRLLPELGVKLQESGLLH